MHYTIKANYLSMCLKNALLDHVSSSSGIILPFKQPLKEGEEIVFSGKVFLPVITMLAIPNGIQIKVAGRSILLK